MEGRLAQPEKCPAARKNPSGKTRVKSGCRTCKIRKVKCDEGRPSCERCTSTGRTCDGYGIWGSAVIGTRSASAPEPSNTLQRPISVPIASSEELLFFEWFRCRSVKKVQGIFSLPFWETLVFQASREEPAVLHATVALSSVHRIVPDHGNSIVMTMRNPGTSNQEIFTLQQYIKAISHLDRHFSAKSKASLRVALITCVLFICLDFFRGHPQTAQLHLQNGLRLLEDIRGKGANTYLANGLSGEPIDDWLSAAMFRFYVQVGLFHEGYRKLNSLFDRLQPGPLPTMFCTISEARLRLDQLTHEIIRLTELSRQQNDPVDSECQLELMVRHKHILADVSAWFNAYIASKSDLLAEQPVRNNFAYQILHMYYFMVKIMADACIWPTDQLLFDSHTDSFTSVLSWAISLRKPARSATETLLGDVTGMSKSMADVGWIPPLYYTAIKCRVHRVRLHAIMLLEVVPHREGIWDGKVLGAAARKVMELEERDFYKDTSTTDDFYIGSYPDRRDFTLQPLPNAHRMHEVRVLLPDSPTANAVLLCRQKQDDGSWRVIVNEYDTLSRSWLETNEDVTGIST